MTPATTLPELPGWPPLSALCPIDELATAQWQLEYQRALAAAYRARLEVAVEALRMLNAESVCVADAMDCTDPVDECKRCQLYAAHFDANEALAAIGPLPEQPEAV